jgi:hypothetical protein
VKSSLDILRKEVEDLVEKGSLSRPVDFDNDYDNDVSVSATTGQSNLSTGFGTTTTSTGACCQ